MNLNIIKDPFWNSLFKRKNKPDTEESKIKTNENMEAKFFREKFSSMYNLDFSYFLNYILVKEDAEEILKQCNYKISDFISKCSYDPIQDIPGIHRWLDGMSTDESIYNLNSKTIQVREKTQVSFSGKIKSLIENKYFMEREITSEIIEAVFLRNSIDSGLNRIMKKMNQ